MSFWDKVKEFVGVDEDYIDDEFYEDYDDLENYKDDRKFDEKDSYEDMYEDNSPSYETEVVKTDDRFIKADTTFNSSDDKNYSLNSHNEKRKEERNPRRGLTFNRTSKNTGMFVTIREPLTYEDGKIVLDDIMDGKSVVLNLEMLEVDKKTQIFYFVSGGLYSLNGTIQNVTKDIYVLAPHGVEIDGSLKDEISNKNLYQL
ncbi:MAG: cell division protein SepF [Tissierellia bacterium]|nr:cell division protein SepF [Tissierellia bacterium]